MRMLENFSDFYVPLLHELNELPNRTGVPSNVLRIIKNKYGDQISQSQLENNKNGTQKWIYNVRMCYVHLRKRGFVESPSTGIWKLSEIGYDWLVNHPNATHLIGISNFNGKSAQRKVVRQGRSFVGIGEPYQVNPKYKLLDNELEMIKGFLSGNNSFQPSAEKLCDWVQFCYLFEMDIEATELFTFIEANDVNDWYYERTKKIAKVCSRKVASKPSRLF